MTQIKKKEKRKKMAGQFWKKTLQETFFTSVLIIAAEIAKTKGKILTRCVFLKIYLQQQKQ